MYLEAPNLTKLVFRISLYHEDDDDHRELDDILREAFPWCGSESMKTLLWRKFPLLQRIAFHFCASHDCHVHFRRGSRRRIERQLQKRLLQARANLGEYLEVEWLDADNEYNPVLYRKTNGKPPWYEWEESLWDSDSELGLGSGIDMNNYL